MGKRYNYRTSNKDIYLSQLVYIIYAFGIFLGDIGYGSVVFSYVVMIMIPFCLDGDRLSSKLYYLFSLLLVYPFIHQIIPIFFIYFFVYKFRNVPIKKIASLSLSIYISCFIIQILLLKYGIIQNINELHSKGDTNTLGYSNSNLLGATIMGLNICIYIINSKKHFWICIITILLLNQWMLSVSSARTPWIATILMVLTAIFYKMKFLKRWTRFIFSSLPLGLTILCYYFAKNAYDYPEFNIIFSNRIIFLNDVLKSLSVHDWLFGYEPVSGLDCAYFGIVSDGGVLWLLFFLYTSIYSIIFKFEQIKIFLPVIVTVLISGLTENTFSSSRMYSILFWLIILNNYNINTIAVSHRNSNYNRQYIH